MSNKGSLIKNITVVCCTGLLISLILFVGLDAQEKSKNEKNNKGIRSIQDDGKIENERFSNDAIEDIEPPEEEDWIEPGDKELYTLKLNCITPETGITGGVLIYYGVYIKPPYELKIVNDTLLINNLPYYGPFDFRKKNDDKWMARIKARKLTDEQEKYILKLKKVINDIYKKHDLLITKYNNEYDNNINIIINELDYYLKNHDLIESFIISPGIIIEFKLKNDLHVNMHQIILKKNLQTIRDPRTDPVAKESEKKYLEKLLQATLVELYQAELNPFSSIDNYLKAGSILQSEISDIEKIKRLYVLLGNLDKAKLVFHNFNYLEFLTDFGDKK